MAYRSIGAPDVDYDDVSDLEFMIRVFVMQAGVDEYTHNLRMSLGYNRFSDVSNYLAPIRTENQKLRYSGMHPIDGSTCFVQYIDLGRLLDHPQTTQNVSRQDW